MSAELPYCSLAEVKQAMKKNLAADDAHLTALIVEACSAIDNYCGWPDGFKANGSPSAREFPGQSSPVLSIDPAARVTAVEIKETVDTTVYTALASTEWQAARGDYRRPVFGDRDFMPYQWLMLLPASQYSVFPGGRISSVFGGLSAKPDQIGMPALPTVRVTANWGYSMETPPAVKAAAIMQVERWFMRERSEMADTATSPDFGMTTFRKSYETLDADVAMILINGRLVRQAF